MKSTRFCLIVALALLACNFPFSCSAKTQESSKRSTSTAISEYVQDESIWELSKFKPQCEFSEDPSLASNQKHPMSPASSFLQPPIPFPKSPVKSEPKTPKSSSENIPFGPQFEKVKEEETSTSVEKELDPTEEDIVDCESGNVDGAKTDDGKERKEKKVEVLNFTTAVKENNHSVTSGKRSASDSAGIDDRKRPLEDPKPEKIDVKKEEDIIPPQKLKKAAKKINRSKSKSVKPKIYFNETLNSENFCPIPIEKNINKEIKKKLNQSDSVPLKLVAEKSATNKENHAKAMDDDYASDVINKNQQANDVKIDNKRGLELDESKATESVKLEAEDQHKK